MADELGPAIAALQQKLVEQQRTVIETKRTINMLLKMDGKSPQYTEDDDPSSSSARPAQFYGKGLATSAAEYLAMRKQACQPDEILRALSVGGFDFDLLGWKEDDRLRSLAISLAKNTGAAGKFHRLKNGSFGLRSWYDEDFLKKVAAGAEATATTKRKAKNKSRIRVAKALTVERHVDKGKPQTLCSRGCGRPPHRGRCKPAANVTAITNKPNSSAKEKGRAEADQPTQKEAAS